MTRRELEWTAQDTRMRMTRPTLTARENLMAAVVHRLAHASDEALQIIATHLGLTPRRESPDAGRPITPVSERGMHE